MRIGAAVGALLAFGAVQATMIAWALRTGERPGPAEWGGLALAAGGVTFLVSGGLRAPDPIGAALMLTAGVAWGVYSLIGRSSVRPLETTAGNFARASAFTLALSVIAPGAAQASRTGLLLAVTSGAIASGVGYSLWYARCPASPRPGPRWCSLGPRPGALGGVLLLGGGDARLVISAAAILGGVASRSAAGTRGRRGRGQRAQARCSSRARVVLDDAAAGSPPKLGRPVWRDARAATGSSSSRPEPEAGRVRRLRPHLW